MREIPGPRNWMPVGGGELATLMFARSPLHRISELFARYGDVACLARSTPARIFSSAPDSRGVVFGRGPDFLRAVETNGDVFHRSATSGRMYPHGEVSPRREKLREWGTGLFAVNGAEHARHRRLIGPAFTRAAAASWATTVVDICDRASNAWKHGDVVDICDAMKDISLRVSTQAIFGQEFGRTSRIAATQQDSLAALISPGALLVRLDLPGFPYRRFLDNVNTVINELHALIDECRSEGAEGQDLLSTMIRESDNDSTGMTDGEIAGHLGVIMAASHETTAFLCSTALLMLSQHPWIACDLVDDLTNADSSSSDLGAEAKTSRLLDAVINESLRLLPPAPWTSRETTREAEVCGFRIPRNVEVIPSIFHTHRMSEIWPAAAAFQPERWEKAEPTPYEFNPFGGGPRLCIGKNLALMEARTILSFLLARYRFQPVENAKVSPCMSITLDYRHGLPMRIGPPDNEWARYWRPVKGTIHEYVDLRH